MSVKQLFQLDGQVALVTGGSRGLGLQMAEALGEMGCKVAISARKADELAEAKKHLESKGITVLTVVNDLQKADNIAPLVDAVIEGLGPIDILVNNAGATWGAPAEDYPDEAWHKVMNLNVTAPFFLAREVGKRCMIPRKKGKIITVASVAGLKGMGAGVQTVAYNTSKAAAINLTRALAGEWGQYNINVNAICPGFFPSKMSAGLLDTMGDAVIARSPLKRIGGDEDLMGTVVFLASEASRHITGQYIAVDGGSLRGMSGQASSDVQSQFTGTQPVAPANAFDEARLAAWMAANVRGLSRPAVGGPVQGRPVQPDLPAHRRRPPLRACAASRWATCCPRPMRWTASSASSARWPRPRCRWRKPMPCAKTPASSARCFT